MPYKDPEKKREWQKQNRAKNIEKHRAVNLKYHIDNPHNYKKASWKRLGVKLKPNEDWVSIYLFYITCEECENCGIELINGQASNSRTLDHDHETGFIRNVLCHRCNLLRDR